MAETLHTPSLKDYQQGVKVILVHFQRDNPLAKQTNFIEYAAGLRNKLPAGIHEALMVGEQGWVLEGLSSNFFAVKNGCLYTAGSGVLQGITQRVVMEIANARGIELRTQGVLVEALPDIDEAFITSASRGILPVCQIGDWQIGDGMPGVITKQLMSDYDHWIDSHIEPI
jgi:branched-chain amino acid aminotransferase